MNRKKRVDTCMGFSNQASDNGNYILESLKVKMKYSGYWLHLETTTMFWTLSSVVACVCEKVASVNKFQQCVGF